jgi:hypothetical protein
MAKMFYTIEEVCEKLGKSEDEVREMAASGQIQEFRDRDRLMFKVEQIDLLASGEEDTGEVHLELEDTSGGSGLELSTSSLGLTDSREASGTGTGVSVFDTDHGEEDAEATRAGEAVEDEDLSLEAVGSGSGLLDLTRESDDTSLGAELLEEVYSGEDNIEIPANASGLFEAAAASGSGETPAMEESAAAAGIAPMPMIVEAYDGTGSGLGVGFMLGALVALICVAIIVIVGVTGATPDLAMKMASSSTTLMMWVGGLLAATVIFGLIGMFIGKSSE